MKESKNTIIANGIQIRVKSKTGKEDYISLTDIAKYKSDDANATIQNWMRNKDVIEFLGLWEILNNEGFKPLEFEGFRKEAGANAFTLSPKKWIEKTNAIGIVSKSGRYGGTFAHRDIAFEFASWISAEFKLYIITDYQRLKNKESHNLSLNWDLSREIAKINYQIHTDSIKTNIVSNLPEKYHSFTYANEADILNVAMFGMTAKQWRDKNMDRKGNIRDYATLQQLIVLSNLESLNAEFIRMNLTKEQRLKKLNAIAKIQMNALIKNVNNVTLISR